MNSLQGGGVFETPGDGLTFGVVGSGKLGIAFITALLKQKSLGWVLCRTEETAIQIAERFDWNVPAVADIEHISDVPDVILIVVPDKSIVLTANLLAEHWGEYLAGKVVIHCSGALGREVLEICEKQGAVTLAAHPFQTFATGSDVAFRGIVWGVECSDDCRDIAENIIRRFGGSSVFLSNFTRNFRGLYHAAAVCASNFIVAVVTSAKDIATAAGIDAEEFLLPIITTATENALQAAENESVPLTGPIVRGDIETIERHIEQFAEVAPDIGFEYALMARATAESARRRGLISTEQYSPMRELLDEAIAAFRPGE
ncbi:Rossmann-like and DUF2520 domain-containing protein [Ignavibacteria bacterium]|nr:DUF2520 domain-containing protein [Bacteroidota bacterium]MCZ2133614.1 DUF2520 domain-containing protein [Bacteroidota bacterium]